jgi:hypothetical protein
MSWDLFKFLCFIAFFDISMVIVFGMHVQPLLIANLLGVGLTYAQRRYKGLP